MALRIRKTGEIVCAAIKPELPCDVYLDDGAHHSLSVRKLICCEEIEQHRKTGRWWWKNQIPEGVEIAPWWFEPVAEDALYESVPDQVKRLKDRVIELEKAIDIPNRPVEDLRAWLLRDFGVDMPNSHGLDLTTVLGDRVDKLAARAKRLEDALKEISTTAPPRWANIAHDALRKRQ